MDSIISPSSRSRRYFWLAVIALVLALGVIMLGAYTRLSDAGLGCPDWPGCYGKLVLPSNHSALTQAQQTFPNQPIVAAKAWKEMVHRYFAGTLGIIILVLAVWGLMRKRENPRQSVLVPWLLVGVVIFQAMLGMWTVTMKLLPLVVMGHLMGGMAIASLLCWLMLSSKPRHALLQHKVDPLRPWAVLGLIIVITQIFLGAWTSTNYAALACPNFPFCHGTLFPTLDWKTAFNFASPIGPDYEGGRLAMNARVTIQMVHRYGAFITVAFWLPFALYLMISKTCVALRRYGWLIFILLMAQFLLGTLNVIKLLPMPIAVGHNGVAALLLITVVAFLHKLYSRRQGTGDQFVSS